ncbi:MAG: hypothetical protein BroJett026_20820 [Betaproteobacteria bacterium]|nr:MAG: hypothetical protein BroJett026_20820 [Betaproteobacteria bacterium]
MVNLATLSALLRSIRQQGGVDGAAGPVERIAHVRRIAGDGEAQVAAQLRHDDRRGVAAAATRADAAAASRVVPAAVARDAPLPAARADAGSPSASLDLTRAGALVAVALKGQRSAEPPSARIEAPLPLAGTARASAIDVARALARSVADSGLFYEAHLARWTRREYPAAALAREPQAQWRTSGDAGGAEALRNAPLPEPAVALLTRQLDALDARALVWTGELWPHQHATITLEERSPTGDDARDGGDRPCLPTWRATVVLDLPSLGPVSATVAMRGETLDVALRAAAAEAQARLAESRGALAAALAESRIALDAFAVAG